jgi:hypothetical protein
MVTGKCFLVLALASVALAKVVDMGTCEQQVAALEEQMIENQKLRIELLDKIEKLYDELEMNEDGEGKFLCKSYFLFLFPFFVSLT